MSCYFRSPKHRTRQLFVLTMRKLATRCQSWMYCSESKVQFLQKIWPLCAALSKSGGRCQTTRRGGTHRKGNRKQGRRCPIFMYLCPIYIYVCAFYGCTCLSQLRVFLNLLSLFCYLIDMVQVPSFRSRNVLEEKVRPRYRGKRAGKQAKERAVYKRHIITNLIRARRVSRKAKPAASSSGHTRLTGRLFVSTPPRNLALLIRLCRLLCSRIRCLFHQRSTKFEWPFAMQI